VLVAPRALRAGAEDPGTIDGGGEVPVLELDARFDCQPLPAEAVLYTPAAGSFSGCCFQPSNWNL